jgi:ATP-dependent DNA helicase RecG
MARDEAQRVIDEDPTCSADKYRLLWNRLRELKKTNVNWGAIS